VSDLIAEPDFDVILVVLYFMLKESLYFIIILISPTHGRFASVDSFVYGSL